MFTKYDKRRQGEFGINELKRVAKELDEEISEDQLEEIIARIDSDGDGKVSFEDFYNVMTKGEYY